MVMPGRLVSVAIERVNVRVCVQSYTQIILEPAKASSEASERTFLAAVGGLRHDCDGPARRLLETRRAGAAAMLSPLMASLRLLDPIAAIFRTQLGASPHESAVVDVSGRR